jgi:hypothetical protein
MVCIIHLEELHMEERGSPDLSECSIFMPYNITAFYKKLSSP